MNNCLIDDRRIKVSSYWINGLILLLSWKLVSGELE